MRMRFMLSVVWAGVTLVMAPYARGDFVPIGDPEEGNSWSQAFRESGVGTFDLVAIRIVSGGPLESPAHRSFNVGGWSTMHEWGGSTPYLSTAIGPTNSDMTWAVWFHGSKSSPLTFDFVAFDGDVKREEARAYWSGSSWSISNFTDYWDPHRPQLVPIPIPAVLAAFGLGGVMIMRRRQQTRV